MSRSPFGNRLEPWLIKKAREIRSLEVIFFAKAPDVCEINKALLYARENEHTQCIKVLLFSFLYFFFILSVTRDLFFIFLFKCCSLSPLSISVATLLNILFHVCLIFSVKILNNNQPTIGCALLA